MDTDLGAITAKLAEGEWVEMDGRSGVGRGLDAVPQAGAPWTSAVCADGVQVIAIDRSPPKIAALER